MISVEVLTPILALAILSLFARVTLGSWVAPGAFFPLFWTGLIVASLAVPEYPLWPVALWWIFASLFLFYAGSFVGGSAAAVRSRKHVVVPRRQVIFPKLDVITLVSTLLGLSYALLRGFFAPTILDTPPLWFQFLLSFLFGAPLFGGMLFASASSNRARRLAVLSVAPAVFFSVTNLGRGPLLASVYFWLAGYWSVRVFLGRGVVPLFTPKVLLTTPILAALLIAMGTGIAALRIIGVESEWSLSDRLALYPAILRQADPMEEFLGFRHGALSHPYAFSFYLKNALNNPPTPQYGILTFSGPLKLLGIKGRTDGYIQFEVEPGIYSNVFTLFMPPIEDFGLEGSMIVFFGSGLISGWAYRRVAQGNTLPIPLLTMFYPHVLVIGGYFFSFNSIVLAHVLVGVYLYWARRTLHRQV